MNGAIGLLIPLGILAYLYMKGSESSSSPKTLTKSNTSTKPNPSPPIKNTKTYSPGSESQRSSYSTTGEFSRSTEGFIPADNCECGGEWIKHVNKSTGGRFFGCSRYPRCENTRDKQQAKNFCSNGHARTSQNTAYNSDGSRRCLVCRPLSKESPSSSYRESQTKGTSNRPSSYDSNLFCRNGHKRTSQNTYVRPDGERECRVCRKNAR